MDKIELKHLVGYLPYRLELQIIDTTDLRVGEKCALIGINNMTKNIELRTSWGTLNRDQIKPILRPLSDLTKYCDDLRFVPINKLAQIAFSYLNFKEINFKTDFSKGAYSTLMNKVLLFSFDSNDNSFISIHKGKTVCVPNQIQLFEKLYEWHFDIHGLIEKGLAIDINTIAS